jgi:microcystin-dependent protein
MSCTNCFTGCDGVTSDQCVKYTGVDIEALDIHTGDTLSHINSSLTTFLLSALDGTGIVPDIDATICTLIQNYLPSSPTLNAVDLISALINASCELQTQIDTINTELDVLNESYNVDCLIPTGTDTHSVVQAVITKLCTVSANLTALTTELRTQYVKIVDINNYINQYMIINSTVDTMSAKMVPYTAIEYYGTLDVFSMSGVGMDKTLEGLGDWTNVYLCNGDNGTPDKRGRIPIGVTDNIGVLPFDPIVEPGINSNPHYTLSLTYGSNFVTLVPLNMPVHTHVATPTITDPTHFHYEFNSDSTSGSRVNGTNYSNVDVSDESTSTNYEINGSSTGPSLGKTSLSSTGISATVLNANAGGDVHHLNVPPVLACYYIMYIPV